MVTSLRVKRRTVFDSTAGIRLIRVCVFSSLLFITCAGLAQITMQDLARPGAANWLSYSGSYAAQRHSLLKQVHTGNAGTLTAKWVYHLAGPGHLEAVPIVANGVMYVPQGNDVDALDARTGRVIWQYRREPVNGRNRGLAISGNKVYIGTAD